LEERAVWELLEVDRTERVIAVRERQRRKEKRKLALFCFWTRPRDTERPSWEFVAAGTPTNIAVWEKQREFQRERKIRERRRGVMREWREGLHLYLYTIERPRSVWVTIDQRLGITQVFGGLQEDRKPSFQTLISLISFQPVVRFLTNRS